MMREMVVGVVKKMGGDEGETGELADLGLTVVAKSGDGGGGRGL